MVLLTLLRLGTVNNVTVATTSTSAASAAFGAQTYEFRIAATAAAFYKIGVGTPTAAATDALLPLNWVEYVTSARAENRVLQPDDPDHLGHRGGDVMQMSQPETISAPGESYDAWPVVARLNADWRVIACRDGIQWILQRRNRAETVARSDWRAGATAAPARY